jgi:hypothetical protein
MGKDPNLSYYNIIILQIFSFIDLKFGFFINYLPQFILKYHFFNSIL